MSFSRRRFLSTTAGAAVTASAAPLVTAHAESNVVQPQSPSWPEIASLPRLAGQSRPFTNAERLARIDRAKTLMAANKIDAIVLTGGTSAVYFADLRLYGSERLWALVIPAKAKPFLVVPAFEGGRAGGVLGGGPV